ncbi:cytochrome c oxidase subunit 5B, mitochondrial-like [Dromiciops gliroides]|uniref:cytochrome c oxidase subunit 5B, mitochondrial-like n=1 Tax=Dromiciops gliroides TaxID=33562 RepID=UPI001CC516B9|nr:cytochrome c oxidase subunit 5B, mitochondrial-like [Dromiciops gliroides]
MASRLLRGAGALVVQALRACGPARAATHSMASRGGIPSDEEQATGLEREIMMAARYDLDPYNMLAPKAAPGTKEQPNLVPFITDKRTVGCICEEDNSAVIWFWLHKGETKHCSNCRTHYKLVPHQLPLSPWIGLPEIGCNVFFPPIKD